MPAPDRRSPARAGTVVVRTLLGLGLLATAVVALPRSASAATAAPAELAADAPKSLPGIDVVQVEGLIDPPNASLVRHSITRAEQRHSTLLVFQLDSGGAVDVDVDALVARVHNARVPIAVWIGPSGATARGGARALPRRPRSSRSHRDRTSDRPTRPASIDPAKRGARRFAISVTGGTTRDALDAHVVDRLDNVLGDLIVGLDNTTVSTARGPRHLSTAEVIGEGNGRRRRPNQDVRFARLGIGGQVLHTLGSPWVAYMLFVAGLALIVFEFYTASIGLAGLTGAIALVGGFTGFSHLPVQWWAIGLLLVGILGFTIDVQAGGLGPWTVIGAVGLVAGSLTLYGGSSRLDPAWWSIVIVCGAIAVFMLGGMTAMIRSRFATPTVGREGLLGEMGTAEVDVAPDGVVRLREARWRARTNRATPIHAGDPVRVVSIDGLVLEVEPETGGAREIHT